MNLKDICGELYFIVGMVGVIESSTDEFAQSIAAKVIKKLEKAASELEKHLED